MPPSKSLVAALCLLGLTLLLRAEAPNDTRTKNDSRPNDPSKEMREKWTIPEEVGGKTFDQWRGDLEKINGDPYNKMQAILSLLAFGDKAADVVPTLNSMVKREQDAGVRAKALWALKVVKINPADEVNTARALGDTIGNDNEGIIRYEAIRAVTRFEKVFAKSSATRHKVVADLLKRLSDKSTCEVRQACIRALIVAGTDKENGPDPQVTSPLILCTKPHYETSKQVRLEAIIALGAMGPPHDPEKLKIILGALRDCARTGDQATKIWTHVSLMALEKKINQDGIDLIVKKLNDDNREIRTHAVTALGTLAKVEELAKKTNEHVKAICTRLEKEQETMVQEAACSALANMGDKGPDVRGALIRLTKQDKQKTNSVVLAACAALTQLRIANPEVMTAMKAVRKHRTLSDPEKNTVEEYIRILEESLSKAPKTGSKTDKVAVETSTGNPARTNNVSPQTSPQEIKVPPIPEQIGGKTYDDWKVALRHDDPYVRGVALMTLLGFREKALDAVPILIPMLNGKGRDVDAGVRVKIVLALKAMALNGADRENAIKALAHAAGHDSQSIVRFEAARALIRLMGEGEKVPASREVIDDLILGAKNPATCELRQACIMALVACVDREKGPESKVTDALIQRSKVSLNPALGEPSKQVRMQAIIALGAVGRPHSPAKYNEVRKALDAHYHSTDKAIKIWTHVSLMALDEKIQKKDINMIVKSLNDPDREVRKQAVTALGAMEKKTSDHVKDICDLLETEKETMVQEAACRVLPNMGEKSERVLKALINLTRLDSRKSNEVVMAACAALTQIHVASPEVLAAMKAVLKHDTLGEQEVKMVEEYIKMIQKPLPDAPRPRAKDAAGEKDKNKARR
jgi:HEAT repeat protein